MVDKVDIERALKDPDYLMGLSREQLASVPWNPADSAAMSEEQLDKVVGGLMASGGGGDCSCTQTGGSCLASKRSKISPTAC